MTPKPAKKAAKIAPAKSKAQMAKGSTPEDAAMSGDRAMAIYGLLALDLRWYGRPTDRAAQYRKHKIKDLDEIAARKKAFLEAVPHDRINRTLQLKRAYKERHQECKKSVSQWEQPSEAAVLKSIKHSTHCNLPIDVWGKILGYLCENMELDGVRGPSVVARDISSAAISCKEIYAASLPAFQRLSTLCRSISASLQLGERRVWYRRPESLAGISPDDQMWESFVRNPKSVKAKNIKALHHELGLTGCHQKSIMISEVLNALKLMQPSLIPARLLIAVMKERTQLPEELIESCSHVPALDNHSDYEKGAEYLERGLRSCILSTCSLFAIRQDCVNHRILCQTQLDKAATGGQN